MKLHWKINLVLNIWLTLFLATSNLVTLQYPPLERVNLIITIVLLGVMGLMNLAMIIYHIAKRLNSLDVFARFLRR